MGAAIPAAYVTYATLAATAVSTGVAVASSIQEGQAAKAQAEYQAAVARNNSILAEQKAQDALDRGDIAERQHRLRVGQAIGQNRASAAARGVLVDQGSALRTSQDIAQVGELDALTIRSNARREAQGFKQTALDFQAQDQLFKESGQSSRRQAALGATQSLISGATSVGEKWYNF